MAEAAVPEHTSIEEVELNDAPDPTPVPSVDAPSVGTAVEVVPMELDDVASQRSVEEARVQVTLSKVQLPVPNGMRTVVQDTESERAMTRCTAGKKVEALHEVVGFQPAEKASQPLCFEIAYQRSVRMFVRGRDAPVDHGGEFVIDDPNVNVCIVVKSAVKACFENHAADICRSPERPDLRLSKEEGQGYLVGSLVIGELLAAEARAIGKRVDYVVSVEEKAKQEAKKQAKEKRRTARATEGEEARAAALAAVEEGEAELLAGRLRESVAATLKLPDRKTAVVESKPKPVSAAAAEVKAADKLGQLRAAAARAEAAVLPAEAHHTAAQRRVERAQKARQDLAALRLKAALSGCKVPPPGRAAEPDVAWETHLQQQDELDAELGALDARLSRLRSERTAAEDAADDARDAAEFARDAVAAEERSRAAATQAAERAAQWAAQEEEWEREREESQARLAVARANVAAAEAALARVRACEPVLWESPAETRERLERHSEMVWSMADERPPPKVFSLVGKSADNVRALAGDVSQEVTSAEERNRLVSRLR